MMLAATRSCDFYRQMGAPSRTGRIESNQPPDRLHVDQSWTDESKWMCRRFSDCSRRTVRVIDLLDALNLCRGTSISVAFGVEIHPVLCRDPESSKLKRKSNKAMSKMMRKMVQVYIHRTLDSRVVLMNSWFSSEWTFDCIAGMGRHFFDARKDKRLLPLSDQDRKNKRFTCVRHLIFKGRLLCAAVSMNMRKKSLLSAKFFEKKKAASDVAPRLQ